MTQVTVRDLMNLLPEFFLPKAALDSEAVIFFDLDGENGGQWIVTIDQGQCTVVEGQGGQPDLTVRANAQDVLDMFSGAMDPTRAYLTGKLQLSGNMSLALRLGGFFEVDHERLKSFRRGNQK